MAKNVDKIIKSLNKIVTNLMICSDQQSELVDLYESKVKEYDDLKVRAIGESNRARNIADNLKKLLGM